MPDVDILLLEELLSAIDNKFSYAEICKMTCLQKQEYDKLLSNVIDTNSNSTCSTQEKGNALEALSFYLIKISGGIFTINKNLRTTTNEVDVVIGLSPSGKYLLKQGLIDQNYNVFIGECKNHQKPVDVTYVGKFCSLLLTNQIKLGILFSYKGITGTGWSYASGLIKKFYLHKEAPCDKYCIIDFNLLDFERVRNGDNFLQIVDEKLNSLRMDTDYSKYISKHPAEMNS